MKYTLNTYGWSSEFIAKAITKEQTNEIKNRMDDNEFEDLSEIRYDLDDIIDDIFDGDLLHINKPLNDGTLNFELLDENGDVILKFGIDQIKSIEGGESYEIEVNEENDVWLTIDQFKGGISSYEFESDEVPTIEDFNYIESDIESPNGYWGIVDEITYKGEVLESSDALDSIGKSSYVYILTNDNE